MGGTCDASVAGAGGVRVGNGVQSTVLRVEWPDEVVHNYTGLAGSPIRIWKWPPCDYNS
jgi:hypothetical protein